MCYKDIRLVALDLDGTTFNSEKVITARTKSAIEAAIRKGIIVIPSTGRPKSLLPKEFISIPGVRYALTSNGGAVVDLKNDEIIHGDFIDTKLACKVIDFLLSIDALIDVYDCGLCYTDRVGYDKVFHTYTHMADWFKAFVRQSRNPIDDLRERVYSGKMNIEKFLASFDDLKLRQNVFEQARKMEGLSVVFGNDFNLEISSKTATKGNSLLGFAKKLGITQDQMMVCGDEMNDESMFEVAGFRVAMGNASESIKAMSDYITLTNDEDGVAHAIEKFLLQ